jgi:hypothetical protein
MVGKLPGRRRGTYEKAKNDLGLSPSRPACHRCERPGVVAFVVDRFGMRPVQACEECFTTWRQQVRNDGADMVRPGCA